MHNEKMQILKMVEDGKITVDEATKLMEAIKAIGPTSPTFEEKFNSFAKDMKEFCKDTGTKINELYKGAEPKIKEFTKNVVAKTASLADNISNSLNEKVKRMEGSGYECECGCEGGDCTCGCCEPPRDNGPRPTENSDTQ